MRLYFYKSPHTDAALNIATEEYLCANVQDDAVTMLLWRNAHTVVIGRNQNPWRELRVDELRKDGGTLVRRLSGGGAVYHDLGNVNYTFLSAEDSHDADKQAAVLIAAAAKFGIKAEKTGRNDITADGRKISGVAYYQIGKKICRHGTILVNTDFDDMGKYLHTPGGKLAGKGVASVKSRVVNLSELADITADSMEDAMLRAFAETYGAEPETIAIDESAMTEILKLRERFASDEWTLGRHKDFAWEAEERFGWGNLHMRLDVREGIVRDGEIFSDAMDAECIRRAGNALIGTAFTSHALRKAVKDIGTYGSDIGNFIHRFV